MNDFQLLALANRASGLASENARVTQRQLDEAVKATEAARETEAHAAATAEAARRSADLDADRLELEQRRFEAEEEERDREQRARERMKSARVLLADAIVELTRLIGAAARMNAPSVSFAREVAVLEAQIGVLNDTQEVFTELGDLTEFRRLKLQMAEFVREQAGLGHCPERPLLTARGELAGYDLFVSHAKTFHGRLTSFGTDLGKGAKGFPLSPARWTKRREELAALRQEMPDQFRELAREAGALEWTSESLPPPELLALRAVEGSTLENPDVSEDAEASDWLALDEAKAARLADANPNVPDDTTDGSPSGSRTVRGRISRPSLTEVLALRTEKECSVARTPLDEAVDTPDGAGYRRWLHFALQRGPTYVGVTKRLDRVHARLLAIYEAYQADLPRWAEARASAEQANYLVAERILRACANEITDEDYTACRERIDHWRKAVAGFARAETVDAAAKRVMTSPPEALGLLRAELKACRHLVTEAEQWLTAQEAVIVPYGNTDVGQTVAKHLADHRRLLDRTRTELGSHERRTTKRITWRRVKVVGALASVAAIALILLVSFVRDRQAQATAHREAEQQKQSAREARQRAEQEEVQRQEQARQIPTPPPTPIQTSSPTPVTALTAVPKPSLTSTPAVTPTPVSTLDILWPYRPYLQRALNESTITTDPGARSSTLEAIAVAQVRAGDLAGAKATAAAIWGTFDRLRALVAIAAAEARAGDLPASRQAFIDARAAAATVGFGRAAALAAIAAAEARAGDLPASRQTFIDARAAAASPDATYQAMALAAIAAAEARAGDLPASRQAFIDARAAATSASVVNPYYKVQALAAIAAAEARAGDLPASRQAFIDARAAAATSVDVFHECQALEAIAVAQARAGDLAGAKATAALRGPSNKVEALEAIAVAQARAGDLAGAKATADSITDGFASYKARALEAIAVAQARAGDLAGAKATAAAISYSADASCKAGALRAIAAKAKTGDLADAETIVGTLDHGAKRGLGYAAIANGLLDAAGKPPPGPDEDE